MVAWTVEFRKKQRAAASRRCVALERRTMRGYRGDEASLLELFARSNTHLVRASCGDEVVGFCLHDEVRALKPQLVPDPRSR